MIIFGEKRNITDFLRFLPGNTSTNGSHGQWGTGGIVVGPRESGGSRRHRDLHRRRPVQRMTCAARLNPREWPRGRAVAEFTVVANSFNAEFGGIGSWFTTVTMNPAPTRSMARSTTTSAMILERPHFLPRPGTTEVAAERRWLPIGTPGVHPQDLRRPQQDFFVLGQGLYYARKAALEACRPFRGGFQVRRLQQFPGCSGIQIPIFDPRIRGRPGTALFGISLPATDLPRADQPGFGQIVAIVPDPDLPQPRPVTSTTGPGLIPISTHLLRRAKLDHSFSTKHKVSLTYQNQWRPRLINNVGWGYTCEQPCQAFPMGRMFWKAFHARP